MQIFPLILTKSVLKKSFSVQQRESKLWLNYSIEFSVITYEKCFIKVLGNMCPLREGGHYWKAAEMNLGPII